MSLLDDERALRSGESTDRVGLELRVSESTNNRQDTEPFEGDHLVRFGDE
jgi:hypothetical protein